MKTIQKIAEAKKLIKNTKLKKQGKNTFSNYEYFTPSQIEELVYNACEKLGLTTKFDLIRNEHGITGFLSVIDNETGEKEIYEMATAIPEIKATNIAQQIGGCMTYTERYLKTTAFGIVDNSLDFDTTENTKQTEKSNLSKEIELAKKTLEACQSLANLEKMYLALEPHLKIALKKFTKDLKTKLETKQNENII